MTIIRVIICFGRIIIDISLFYGRKRKMCNTFKRKKMTSLFDGKKVKYVPSGTDIVLTKVERQNDPKAALQIQFVQDGQINWKMSIFNNCNRCMMARLPGKGVNLLLLAFFIN